MKQHEFFLCSLAAFAYDRVELEVIKMQINETWSITAERIRDFFLSQDDILQKEDNRFVCGQCEILLTSLPHRNVGRFLFPQTGVEFRGPKEETESTHWRFVLQFISAGG